MGKLLVILDKDQINISTRSVLDNKTKNSTFNTETRSQWKECSKAKEMIN